ATQHMSAELFKQIAGIDMVSVQFRTTPEAVTAVLGKQVDVLFDTVLAVIGQVQSGPLTALAVKSKYRFPRVPDVPAIAESAAMKGYDVSTWYGFFGPRGIPPEIVAKLNQALNDALAGAGAREELTQGGARATR